MKAILYCCKYASIHFTHTRFYVKCLYCIAFVVVINLFKKMFKQESR